jgi:hypothetical protein
MNLFYKFDANTLFSMDIDLRKTTLELTD